MNETHIVETKRNSHLESAKHLRGEKRVVGYALLPGNSISHDR